MGARTARMHHSLRYTLTAEALQLLQQLHILQQGRAVGAGSLRVLVVADGRTIVAGKRSRMGRKRKYACGKHTEHQSRRRKAKQVSVHRHVLF